MQSTLSETIGKRMGQAIAKELDIDLCILFSGFQFFSSKGYQCPRCDAPYKTMTWFRKHLRKTEHYLEIADAINSF